ncbi:hypothetical protein [Nonomuraea sp. B19D2]|uniref:hypothetical protein n=1 Tax=Nonomuraea sp. B19D2 TaxID=3159561 RepID=UPI0032DA1F4D
MISPTAPRAAASLSRGGGRARRGLRPARRAAPEDPGYAVSLVKAGSDIRGRSAGPVRAPLAELTPEQREQLARIIDRGLAALGATPVA